MKLTKISLAAIVALGAFSSVASATPLEEAIKNVDLSGFARYRYNNLQTKETQAGATTSEKKTVAGHNFKAQFAFKAALDDNFFGVLALRYNKTDGSGGIDTGDYTDTTSTFGVKEFYLGYKVGNTTVTAGKQTVGSYFTDDEVGTGLRVTNQDIAGLTLTALAFDALEADSETDGDGHKYEAVFTNIGNPDKKVVINNNGILDSNLYAIGVAGSYDPVNFELWYASLTDIANIIAADAGVNFDVTSDFNLGLRANYAHASLDETEIAKRINKAIAGVTPPTGYTAPVFDKDEVGDTNFYAAELSTGFFGVDLSAGYIGWKVKDKRAGFVSLEDQGSFIDAGEDFFDYTALEGKSNNWFAKVGYKIDKYGIGAEYMNGKTKKWASATQDEETKANEFIVRASYDYSKKLSFSGWYYTMTEKNYDVDGKFTNKEKSNKFRFETKYKF
jgi:major outer membrane protein